MKRCVCVPGLAQIEACVLDEIMSPCIQAPMHLEMTMCFTGGRVVRQLVWEYLALSESEADVVVVVVVG